jgi:uncharacterized protein YxjI
MIKINCNCGSTYNFKNEMLGKEVVCKKCNNLIKVVSNDKYFSLFNRNKFFLNQKHFSLSEKYFVFDENANKLLGVKRDIKWFRTILGVIVGIILAAVYTIAFTVNSEEMLLANLLISLMILNAATIYIRGKRHIYFYEINPNGEMNKDKIILKIEQINIFQILNSKFEVKDHNKNTIAFLDKKNIFNFFRRRWHWKNSDRETVALIKEESILLSILRRLVGNFFGLLRMNFIFKTTDNITFGEFNRKLSLRDKYVLDLSVDEDKIFDRKVCLALGVLLDTGERR